MKIAEVRTQLPEVMGDIAHKSWQMTTGAKFVPGLSLPFKGGKMPVVWSQVHVHREENFLPF